MKGRAKTPEQKRAVIKRLYAAWVAVPDLRLGQLLDSVPPMVNTLKNAGHADLYYVEDEDLADAAERLASGLTRE